MTPSIVLNCFYIHMWIYISHVNAYHNKIQKMIIEVTEVLLSSKQCSNVEKAAVNVKKKSLPSWRVHSSGKGKIINA